MVKPRCSQTKAGCSADVQGRSSAAADVADPVGTRAAKAADGEVWIDSSVVAELGSTELTVLTMTQLWTPLDSSWGEKKQNRTVEGLKKKNDFPASQCGGKHHRKL